ncbi:NAD/NADP octopine/nopaline dehydrogenase family protein [Candidatus Acetothermia bacterium]|nr:NAD/NADP octopine/nopaline dehydrogenase family protein [Candidatus Acetothermia bacterium]MCI2427288.1 NAD/NADP octopine/nopaline dehydrogenase family protein [Candidatus Acetothermia bacterium]MCI2428184.1 NAD/NADP octopine/nopaline dehydrogenase family protein [Candidatus Acetothermia bacterium]
MFRIAVLGGGHGGHCMAADLTLRGYTVSFYEHRSFAEQFNTTLTTRKVQLSGIGPQGIAQIDRVTIDIEEAMDGAAIVNVVIPAFGHDLFFAEMIPFLSDGQIIVVWAGDFGSLRLAKLLQDKGVKKKITIAETNTIPYGCRLHSPAHIKLLLTAPQVVIAALPGDDTSQVMAQLSKLWPALMATDNVLVAALSNPNPIVHPPGALLNTGRIQYSQGEFYMYREGITEAVARVIKGIYTETAALAKALGCKVVEYEARDFKTPTSIMGVAFQAPFDTQGVIASVRGPNSIHNRYITEDLPYGLVPMSQLGDKLDVPTPLIDAIIHIGAAVCNSDFWQSGRSLASLGLAEMNREEIIDYVTTGRG